MAHRLRNLCLSIALAIGGWLIASPGLAAPLIQDEAPIYIYFFWGDGCPHCEEAKPFLEDLAQRYPTVQVEAFEVWYDTDNQALLQKMSTAHGFEPHYVPTIFIGEQHWEGFADPLRPEIEAAVRSCVEGGCADPGLGIVPGHATAPEPIPSPTALIPNQDEDATAIDDEATGVRVYLFWGDVCSSCDTTKSHLETQSGLPQFGSDGGGEALEFLRMLEADTPGVQVEAVEVWLTSTNRTRFEQIAETFGVRPRGVPTIIAGDRIWEEFSSDVAAEVKAYVLQCLAAGCPDPAADAMASQPTPVPEVSETDPDAAAPSPVEVLPPSNTITMPLLGSVDLGGRSLWASTALISFADGFNPCSLWVLSILIALTLRTGSRKRIFVIGLIYIAVTAGIYVLFIAGLFTFLTVVSFLGWIQAAVSVLALFFAAISIKDYFWYKEGLSMTIADEKKPGIYRRIRRVMNAGNSFWTLAGATVALGAGVSLVEFSCTAGFPVVWTNLVAAQSVPPVTFALLLLLYMVIYQIDELAIFGAAVLTMKASRLEEKHGRMLKLIGGMLMLTLAAVMLTKPALMNDLGTSVLIFGIALVAAMIVLVVHRVLLPRMGILIGTELAPERVNASRSSRAGSRRRGRRR